MRAKVIKIEAVPFTNPNTGEKGTEHTMSILADGQLVQLRVSQDFYRQHQTLPELADVELRFCFTKGRFRHFIDVADVKLVPAARAS